MTRSVKQKLISSLPELIFGTVAIACIVGDLYFSTANALTSVFGVFLLLLIVSALWRNEIFGSMFSISIILICLWMILAVISEYREFPAGDKEGLKLLLAGCSIFLSSAALAFWMLMKHVRGN